ncbi:MAG TPA: c-type cytochrome, partial [Pirellulales bacterium]
RRPDCAFWPDQVLKDAVACLAVLAVVLLLVLRPAFTEGYHLDLHDASRLGAELGAPADQADQYLAARPEWYFLFLFQMLKYFPGSAEFVGAIVVPGLVMLILAAMPLVGRWKLGHGFNVAFLFALIIGAGTLTYRAWWDDHHGPDAAGFQAAVVDAEEDAHRAAELAAAGIPPEGAIALVRHDPQIQGRKLFKAKCAQCHGAAGSQDGKGQPKYDGAPKLDRFASRDWLAGLLSAEAIDGPDYFGNTSHHAGDMSKFVKEDLKDWKKDEIENVIIALSAEAHLPEQAEMDARDKDRIAAGVKLIKDDGRCAQCHVFYDAGSAGSAPELTGYGSRKWLTAFISNPAAERFYGENNDRMPAFADHPPGSPQNELGQQAIELLADWLRRDWNPGKGAEPVAAAGEQGAEK